LVSEEAHVITARLAEQFASEEEDGSVKAATPISSELLIRQMAIPQ
jgi:hypothetical protein